MRVLKESANRPEGRNYPIENQYLWLFILTNLGTLTSEEVGEFITRFHTHRQKGEFPPIAQLATEIGQPLNKEDKRGSVFGKKRVFFDVLSQTTFNPLEIRKDPSFNLSGLIRIGAVKSRIELVGEDGQRRTRERFSITLFGYDAAETIATASLTLGK